MHTNYLITGGTGAFGQAFVERLLRDGLATRIAIYSRDEVKQYWMRQKFNNDSRLRFFIGDVRDRHRLRRAFDGVDIVVHAAALKRIESVSEWSYEYNAIEAIKTNVGGTVNVIEAAQDAKVKKVCFLSSDKAFQPVSVYGKTKALAESAILAANQFSGRTGPRFMCTRYGNVWGSTGSVGPVWAQMLEDGETHLPITSPDCTRFFMWMDEAVQLVLDTLRDAPTTPAIPTLPAYRLGDLAEAMGAKTIELGLGPHEKVHESMEEGNSSDKARRMTVDELREAIKRL